MDDRIELSRLRDSINAILDHIEHGLNVKELSIKKNFYWEVDSSELFKVDVRPCIESIGSLLDDWQFVADAALDKSQALPLVLLHVAPLLRYMAEKLSDES